MQVKTTKSKKVFKHFNPLNEEAFEKVKSLGLETTKVFTSYDVAVMVGFDPDQSRSPRISVAKALKRLGWHKVRLHPSGEYAYAHSSHLGGKQHD